ncbi:lipoate--protein ligase family protein [Rothia sp. AR01]|uniref:Lipoate--protein ligase family protein n=1 Tax=Rothia santali TaxID=2949643 RepID=A0A9X2HAB4_9MICC|nr:lipoate--protein ligase family protein [Rothia santali]MCP3424485.1 lipoate--protein ligase family protein [Rothia santali]
MQIERAGAQAGRDGEELLARLRRIAAGQEGALLRISRPEPTVAFGRRDELNPGYAAAAAAVRAAGFAPIVRKVGGRAAAYHRTCLIVDHLQPARDATSGNLERYREFGALWVRALADLGVEAGVGELPREYCPGEFSVHARLPDGSRTKLVGTAQRVVAGGWWFSAAVVVGGREPLAEVLTEAYARLGLDLDPATVGSVEQAVPEARWEDVEDAVLAEYERWDGPCADGT